MNNKTHEFANTEIIALNSTATPRVREFPFPDKIHVTNSPEEPCGAIPRNQTLTPSLNTGPTVPPTSAVTHPLVTYHTVLPNGVTRPDTSEGSTVTMGTTTEMAVVDTTPTQHTGYPTLITTIEREWTGGSSDDTTFEPGVTSSGGETTLSQGIDVSTTEEVPFSTTESVFESSTTTSGSENAVSSTETGQVISETPQDGATTEGATTDGIPFPSPFPTDDFVVGHWFSTEESEERTTTEVPEIAINATIGSVGIVTNTPVVGPDIPTPQPLNPNENPNSDTTAFPTPSNTLPTDMATPPTNTMPFIYPTAPGNAKVLILKMRVPDGVDVNSPEFTRNITDSLKRLVRDTRVRIKKRFRRKIDASLNSTIPEEIEDSTQRSLMVIEDDERRFEFPVKVTGITKGPNITEIVFSFEDFEVTQAELERALYDLETTDLNEYFAFPTTEHITAVEKEIELVKEIEKIEDRTTIILLGGAGTLALLIILVIAVVIIKKKETSSVLQRMGRHFNRYTAPSNMDAFHREHPSA